MYQIAIEPNKTFFIQNENHVTSSPLEKTLKFTSDCQMGDVSNASYSLWACNIIHATQSGNKFKKKNFPSPTQHFHLVFSFIRIRENVIFDPTNITWNTISHFKATRYLNILNYCSQRTFGKLPHTKENCSADRIIIFIHNKQTSPLDMNNLFSVTLKKDEFYYKPWVCEMVNPLLLPRSRIMCVARLTVTLLGRSFFNFIVHRKNNQFWMLCCWKPYVHFNISK